MSTSIYQPTIKLGTFTSGNVSYQDTYLDDNNNIAMVSDINSVAQTVSNAVSLWLGEYQFDTTIGIPWGNILGQPVNRLLLNSQIQTAVLTVPYVTDIISINYTFDDLNRKTTITVTYNTNENTIEVANATI